MGKVYGALSARGDATELFRVPLSWASSVPERAAVALVPSIPTPRDETNSPWQGFGYLLVLDLFSYSSIFHQP